MDCLKNHLFLFVVMTTFCFTEAYSAQIKECNVKFSTTGTPGLVTINGESETPCEGNLGTNKEDLKESKIVLNLEKLDTGISLRNRHLKEKYLEVDKYPNATLTKIEAIKYAEQMKGLSEETKFQGLLELHGVKKSIIGKYKIVDGKKVIATFEIKLSDYGIEIPSFMGITVVDKVDIQVNLSI